jgi:hypothetical protein
MEAAEYPEASNILLNLPTIAVTLLEDMSPEDGSSRISRN